MNEHYLTWDEYEEMDPDDIPRWVDAHSVTCALCGELADERETVSLWEDESGYASNPDVDLSEYPEGEAHQTCFEKAKNGEKPKSGW